MRRGAALAAAVAAALAALARGQASASTTSVATATRTASAPATVTLPPGTTPSVTAAATLQPAAPAQYAMNGRDAQRTGDTPWLGPLEAPTAPPGIYDPGGRRSLGGMAVDANGVVYVAYTNATLRAISFDAVTLAPTVLWTAGVDGASALSVAPALDSFGAMLLTACPADAASVCALRTTDGV